MKALLLGGTGMVGSKLLEKLLLNGSIEHVSVITRRPLENNNPKIRQILIESFDDPQAFPVDQIKGHDVLFNCMGTTRAAAGSAETFVRIDHDYPLSLIKLHDGHGLVLLTAVGSDANSWFLYPKTKGRLEQACQGLKFPNLAIMRPGLLMLEGAQRRNPRFFEGLSISLAETFNIKAGTARISTVAESMLQTALGFDPNNKTPSCKIYENKDILSFEK